MSGDGLRGVGKTQIAAAYARARQATAGGLIGWVNAETRDVLLDGLHRVAEELGVADPEGDSLESARRLRQFLQTRAGRVCWCSTTPLTRMAAGAPACHRRRPDCDHHHGPVLRHPRAARGCVRVHPGGPVDRLPTGPYRAGRSRRRGQHRTTARGPAAGAGPSRRDDRSPATDLYAVPATLHQVPVRDLLGRSPGEYYPNATAAALLLSVQATEDNDPTGLAGWLLRVLAALSPDGIPRAFLDSLPRARPRRRLRCHGVRRAARCNGRWTRRSSAA